MIRTTNFNPAPPEAFVKDQIARSPVIFRYTPQQTEAASFGTLGITYTARKTGKPK